jgi:hypothetical protein
MMDRLAALDKELRYFADIGFSNWTEPTSDRYTALCDDIVDLLTTSDGEPAVNNIAFMRSQGWRINIENKHDKDFGPFWYGELFVWGPYNITFKWTGEDSVGV